MTPEQRPSASASGLGRSIRARLRVGSGVARRVGVAGALLASFLVATSWLVSPAPQVDGTFLRFLAISTTCEMLLWFAIVLITRRVFVSSALCGLTVGAVIVTNNLKHEYTAVAALPVDAYAAIGVVYDLSTFVGYVELHIAEVSALVVLCGLVVLGFLKERVLFTWSRRTLAITEPHERHVDVSFLGSLVLDAAGVNSGEFFRMSSTYREFCGGSFGSCREGERYQQSYVQILFDFLREQLRDDRARGAVATNAMMPTYRLGDIVRVGSEHFGAGWANESWGAWTVAPVAHLDLRLQSVPADDLVMAARVRLSRTLDSAQILINGEPLATWSFGPSAPHLRQVIIPADRIPADGSLRLTFNLTVPYSQRELGIGSEERRLGVALYGIRLCQRSAGECLVPES